MSVTVTDPQLLSELAAAENEVELVDPAGRSLGVLTRTLLGPGVYLPGTGQPPPVMTRARAEAIIAVAKKVGEDPLFEEYLQAIADYRREHNTVEDVE